MPGNDDSPLHDRTPAPGERLGGRLPWNRAALIILLLSALAWLLALWLWHTLVR